MKYQYIKYLEPEEGSSVCAKNGQRYQRWGDMWYRVGDDGAIITSLQAWSWDSLLENEGELNDYFSVGSIINDWEDLFDLPNGTIIRKNMFTAMRLLTSSHWTMVEPIHDRPLTTSQFNNHLKGARVLYRGD